MSKALRFWKYHGLGNDFVIVESAIDATLARGLCHRDRGVGADGVLVVTPSLDPGHAGVVKVWNSDGSEAEICGNGMRCVTLHLFERFDGREAVMTLETDAGDKVCRVVEHPRCGVAVVEVEMGQAQLERASVPVIGEGRMVEAPLELSGRLLSLTAVGMGNPHAVAFGDFTLDDVRALGPRLETHPLFPAGVNAGFATVRGGDRITLTVWERGAGLTGACGSGACAAAVAACETGRAERGRPLKIEQPGGVLTITVAVQGTIIMRGPAQRVFTGEVDLALLPTEGLAEGSS
jgi:diaminopimelate epimerase